MKEAEEEEEEEEEAEHSSTCLLSQQYRDWGRGLENSKSVWVVLQDPA